MALNEEHKSIVTLEVTGIKPEDVKYFIHYILGCGVINAPSGKEYFPDIDDAKIKIIDNAPGL